MKFIEEYVTISLVFAILATISQMASIVVRLFSPNFAVPWDNPIFTISVCGFYLFAVLALGAFLAGISQTIKRETVG